MWIAGLLLLVPSAIEFKFADDLIYNFPYPTDSPYIFGDRFRMLILICYAMIVIAIIIKLFCVKHLHLKYSIIIKVFYFTITVLMILRSLIPFFLLSLDFSTIPQ